MNRAALVLLVGAALAVGIVAYRSRGGGPDTSSAPAATRPADDAPSPYQARGSLESTAADASTDGLRATVSSAGTPAGSADGPPARRPITLYERDTVRELIKLHAGLETPQGVVLDSNLPDPAWPVDDDSLFLKYGSFDKARTQAELASIQAILDWQNDGPFEDKHLEILPPALLRAFELEREWLAQRVQNM